MELRGGVQHRPPPLGLHQRRDTLADLLMHAAILSCLPVFALVVLLGWVLLVCVLVLIWAFLSRPPKRVRVGRCPPALRAVGSPLRRKAARRGRSGSPDKGGSPRSFPAQLVEEGSWAPLSGEERPRTIRGAA